MKLLFYCTKGKPFLLREDLSEDLIFIGTNKDELVGNSLNGKIVAECDYEVEEIRKECIGVCKYCYRTKTLDEYDLMYNTQLDGKSMNEYLQGKGYAIHIKNLHIFDEPKELEDYYNVTPLTNIRRITNAPQNMRYVQDYFGHKYALISIRPEWLGKILSGEKKIEVRKKVLNEMIK